MDEKAILHHINEFIEEEHALRAAHERAETSDADAQRRRQIEVVLDQCWDLLGPLGHTLHHHMPLLFPVAHGWLTWTNDTAPEPTGTGRNAQANPSRNRQ